MDGLCDVLSDPNATFTFKAPGKMIKGLWTAFHHMAETDCHLILTADGIEIQEVATDQFMMMKTFISWTKLGQYDVNIPKGFDGIVLRVNLQSLVNMPNIGKDIYLSFIRETNSPEVQVVDPSSPKSNNQVTIMASAPSMIQTANTWKHDVNFPQAVEPAVEQASNFQSKSRDHLLMTVYPRGITLQKPQTDGRKQGIIGYVPDTTSPFFDEDEAAFLEMMLPPSQIKAMQQLCRIGDSTIRFYIHDEYDHIKILIGVGSLCTVFVELFGNPPVKPEESK